MTALTTFNFQSLPVRILLNEDRDPVFCAKDVCNILGYANAAQAVQKNCKKKGISVRDTLTKGGLQSMAYITEANLYRLIIKSKKPQAEAFEEWVFEEVLPTIRKTGGYQLPVDRQTTKQQIVSAVKLASTATGKHPQAVHKALREHFGYPNMDTVQPEQLAAIMAFLSDYVKCVSANALPAPKSEKSFIELNIPAMDAVPDRLATSEYYSLGTMYGEGYSKDSPIQRFREAVKSGKPIVSCDLSGLAVEINMLEGLAMINRSIAKNPEVSVNPQEYVCLPDSRWR